ncbi:MAG: DmsC/YnfH family molybdoenzyme membrane anchor subunit [Candidatus Aminicenantales bacterium]
MLKEWPLVAFTIAGQTAVGAFLLVFPLLVLSPAETAWSSTARGKVLVIWGMTFGLVAIAAGLSFFHLHHPFRAHRTLANFRTSWLSREIFFELAFIALLALALVLVVTGRTAGPFIRAVMAAAALAAILFLVSMGRLYALESVPSWDPAYIGISFFLTAVSLGAMATAWATGSPLGTGSYFSALWSASFYFIAADAVFAAFVTPVYGIVGYRPTPSLRPPVRGSRLLFFGRLALLAGGVFVLIMVMSRDEIIAGAGTGSGPLLTLAFALVLASEVAGRFLFYGFAPRPGD